MSIQCRDIINYYNQIFMLRFASMTSISMPSSRGAVERDGVIGRRGAETVSLDVHLIADRALARQ